MAFVKMLRTAHSWEEGRSYDLDDEQAALLVKQKYATAISANDYVEATRAVKDAELRDSIMDEMQRRFRTLMPGATGGGSPDGGTNGAATPATPAPPNGGGGINFGHIAGGNDPAARANELLLKRIESENRAGRSAGMAEIMGLVGILAKPQLFSPTDVQHAQRRMQGLCGFATEQVFNETTGRWDYKETRSMGNGGGLQTIIRTGTDSLAGGTTYGFAVKPEYLGNIFEISMEQQVFANAAMRIPVGQGVEVKYPAWDQYQAPVTAGGVIQSATYAGISLYYETEAAPRVPTDGKLNMIDFKIVDLTAFTALSRDFVVDNYLAFDAALTRMIGRAFGWMTDYMSIQGPGIGRPQGYLNSPATLAVTRHASNTITSNDLTSMIASVTPMVWGNLRWITNITTIPQLAILYNNAGTPVFQPNALITQAQEFSIMDKSVGGTGAELMHRPMGTLLGFPVYFSEKVAALGNPGDLSLVAPSQYGVAERSGVEIAVSEHYYFLNDLIAYRLKQRHDMKSLWRGPYTQADGSNTLVSPFVVLH